VLVVFNIDLVIRFSSFYCSVVFFLSHLSVAIVVVLFTELCYYCTWCTFLYTPLPLKSSLGKLCQLHIGKIASYLLSSSSFLWGALKYDD